MDDIEVEYLAWRATLPALANPQRRTIWKAAYLAALSRAEAECREKAAECVGAGGTSAAAVWLVASDAIAALKEEVRRG